ncbi:MAG: cysteine hydrolase [Candidatus Binatia bacterium]
MIRWAGMEILDTLDELVDPKHTTLLMWDFAKNVVSNTFNYDSLIQNTGKLLQAARENHVPVIYSRQNNMRIMGDTGAPTIRMRFKRSCKPLSDLANQAEPRGFPPLPELVKEVAPQEDEIIFEKFGPNAFLGTCFEWWLRKLGTKTILVTGVNLATGVNATAREAINLGYYGVVIRDCVGTGSKEDYDIAMAATERVVDVFDAAEIIEVWNKKKQ